MAFLDLVPYEVHGPLWSRISSGGSLLVASSIWSPIRSMVLYGSIFRREVRSWLPLFGPLLGPWSPVVLPQGPLPTSVGSGPTVVVPGAEDQGSGAGARLRVGVNPAPLRARF